MESRTETAVSDNSAKKSVLDDLNREDLINKCKGLLAIAQKAKQAKTDLQNEVENYKLLLVKSENEKKANLENIKTLGELVESLTQQKLSYITELDLAQNKVKSFTGKCNTLEEEIKTCKADLSVKDKYISEITQKLSDLDTEAISLSRQNKRLLEENEQLINQLTELEAQTTEFNTIGLQQREQLRILEEKADTDETYKGKIEELQDIIRDRESKLEVYKSNILSDCQVNEYENKIKEITQLYESEKNKKEKANIKLKSYKDKILKCAACINQLKNSRFILSKTVQEYSENIPKWQNDIIKASQVLDDRINELECENKCLKEKLLQLNINEASSSINCDQQITQVNISNNEKISLENKIAELHNQNHIITEQNNMLLKELTELKSNYSQLCAKDLSAQNQNKLLEDKVGEVSAKNNSLNNELLELKAHYQELIDKQLHEHKLLHDQINEISNEKLVITNDYSVLKTKYDKTNEHLSSQKQETDSMRMESHNIRLKSEQLLAENNKLNDLVKDLNHKCQVLTESVQSKTQQKDIMDSLSLQIKALESEKAILVKEKLNARDYIAELESRNKTLTDQVNVMASEIKTMKSKLDEFTREEAASEFNNKLEKDGELKVVKSQIITLQEQYDLLRKEHDNLQDLNVLLKEEVETLKMSLEQPNDDADNLSDLNVSLQADIVKLETKLSAYKQENASLLVEVKESRTKVKEYDKLVAEYEQVKSVLANYKTENIELLNEMKEVNQVLKERGEAISKLQKAVSEMERLIETLEKDRDTVNQERDDLIKKIVSLEDDLKNAKQKTNRNSDVIEQMVIERDNTLKSLADKESVIINLKDDLEKLKQIQTSTDLPNEDMSTSTISKAEENSRMKDLDETFEDKYTKLRIFALKLKKKLNETTTQLQNAELDKTKLEKMLLEATENKSIDRVDSSKMEEHKTMNPDLELKIKANMEASQNLISEIEKVKAELAQKSRELTAEVEAHKATKDNLDKARRDVKKKNVLSLEMEDYERSMKDLTAKMEESKKKIIQMESTIDTQEGTITAMKTQIKLLEEQIKTEETQNRLHKEECQHALEAGKEKDNVIQNKSNIISKLEHELEDERRKNEEADLEMTNVLSEKEKIIMSLGDDKAELNNKLKKLEFKCADLSEKLTITNIELADMKTEYTSYKVRAQAVLRQNQTIDHSQEEQLKEEAAALRSQIETLTVKLLTAQEQCSKHNAALEASRRRTAEAVNETARAQQRTARLQADLTRLGQQLEAERMQHKLQVSTLTQCNKNQINELEIKAQKEIDALRKQLSAVHDNMKTVKVSSVDQANHNQYMLPVIPKEEGSDGEMDINVSMIPREEGEGSESAPSPPLSKSYLTSGGSSRSPVPLDRLLEEGVPEDDSLDTASLALTPEQEISDLKRKLQSQQQRVKHVTILLSESERECARMAQLAELLKSELRRARGTSHSAHNAEYMKNVTLKFLTLPPGDERSRLVPVLHKILTLTPDENQKIQAIARGLDPNPSKGWGSYLPWPGGK